MCSRADVRRAALAAILAGVLGCTGDAPAIPSSGDVATVLEDTTPARERGRLGGAIADASTDSRFPHDPHAGFDCRQCHASVRGHTRHQDIACAECHPSAVPISGATGTVQDCSSCHHARTQERGCTHCHDALSAPALKHIDVAAKFSNAVGARVRSLPFRHAVHAGLACTRCHGAAVDAPVAAACASCHEQHHTRNANCAGCHQPPPPTAHAAGAHEGCSGAGCHEDAAVIALPLSRPVCLACHRAQAAHEPDAECGTCHVVALQAPRNTQVAAP